MTTNQDIQGGTPEVATGMDWSAILNASIRTFIFWAIVITLITWKGAPGVLCITPIAWLLAAWVAKLYLSRTRSHPSQWVKEAALAGGLFGLLQGALFVVLGQVLMPLSPGEQANMLLLGIGSTAINLAAGAFLAGLVVMRQRKRLLANS
jgi:hydrogenase-4 membrane subunit HyfE